ncbi:MAG: enoyl-CoA hydratase-related protein [Rhodococcus sp. (in: high G+C Gram-positive bacteria)]|uniref:enoyl-CoA hydratase-related protein n=1 Tax=Rhodococcus sp. TaxID=1831 RepID=UPI003BAF1E7E
MNVTLNYVDKIAVLNLGDDENRFSPEWLDAIDSALDTVEAGDPTALVSTGTGKFFSNGLDLDWLTSHGDRAQWYVGRVQQLLARVLTLPVPTVAAVNGHAFGAGAMFAMAHDFRAMRADRGYFCFPEIDIRIPFTPGMAALIQAKTTPQTAVAAMTTGRRFGGHDAHGSGLVDVTADDSGLLIAAAELVTPLIGKDAVTLGAIKATMFAAPAAVLTQTQP